MILDANNIKRRKIKSKKETESLLSEERKEGQCERKKERKKERQTEILQKRKKEHRNIATKAMRKRHRYLV